MNVWQLRRPRALLRDADEWMTAKVQPLFHDPIYRLISADLKLQTEDELLDVGCAAGVFLAKYGASARRVAGLDISASRVAMACRRLAGRITAGTAEIVAGDAVALPWRDDTFSALTCMESLELFADPQAALQEMCRVLRPGGRAALTMGSRVTPRVVRSWQRRFQRVPGRRAGSACSRAAANGIGAGQVSRRCPPRRGPWATSLAGG